jgi:hypothetical protein
MVKLFDINYTGEWLQNIVVGLVTGLISGIFVSLLFVLDKNPLTVGPYLIGFGAFIAVIVSVNVVVQSHREKVNRSKAVKIPEMSLAPPTNDTNSPDNLKESDIDDFCKSVIAWKVSATKKDEIFQLFKDNPYYLMGYLAYITKKDIEETKALQKKIIGFTMVSIIIAIGSMAFAGYAIDSAFFIPGMGVYALVLFGIFHVLNKSKR